jgi:hypothetical protein
MKKKKTHKHKFRTTTFFGKILWQQCGCGMYRKIKRKLKQQN